MDAVLHSSKRMDWQTPEHVLDRVRAIGPIGLDPATTSDNPTGARLFLTPEDDGLETYWPKTEAREAVWLNPPYGRQLREWVAVWRCSVWAHHRLLLVPSRTDTAWWRLAWDFSKAVCFVSGRLKFKGADHPAPFPSAIFYAGKEPWSFESAFHDLGIVVRL